MTQLINQFAQTPEPGDLDLLFPGGVISARAYASLVTPLVPGQAVKLVDVGGGVPVVTALAADTDATFGFVVRNLKDISFAANEILEVAIQGSVQYMVAGAAIARGAKIEVVTASTKVITNAGTNPVAGFAFDKATADGDVIRVFILTPGYSLPQTIADISGLQTALDLSVKTARVTATLAEINAGKTIVPASGSKQIRVVNYAARVVGTFGANTSVDLQSGTTGTKVTALGVAGLTNGAILQPSSSNTTLGAGFAADLEAGETLKVVNVGSAATTATSITFTVSYVYV